MKIKRIPFNHQPKEPSREPRFSACKTGVEVQTWGLDASQNMVCAGVHYVPELSARWIYRLFQNWRRWRKWYDNRPENRKQDYPAKHCKPLAFYGAHPINNPKATLWLSVKEAA